MGSKKQKLIINADDYGYSPLFNRAILELAQKNIITSTTVMIKRKYIKPSELKEYKNLSIGLHLELKEKDSQKEIEKQIKEFFSLFGQMPSHLDGHKHTHVSPTNLPKILKIAKKYKLPIRSRLDDDRKIIISSDIRTPDNYISWHPKRKLELFDRLKNNKARITEMVSHPGYYDKNCVSSYNRQREKELKILKSREFRKIINHYQLINYHEI